MSYVRVGVCWSFCLACLLIFSREACVEKVMFRSSLVWLSSCSISWAFGDMLVLSKLLFRNKQKIDGNRIVHCNIPVHTTHNTQYYTINITIVRSV